MTDRCSLNGHSNPDNDHVTAPAFYGHFPVRFVRFACVVRHIAPL
jgi:hypothetical protein